MEDNEILYTVQEAAKLLKIGRNKVYDLLHAGLLPCMNLGGWKIRREAILKFLDIYENHDLSDLSNIHPISLDKIAPA